MTVKITTLFISLSFHRFTLSAVTRERDDIVFFILRNCSLSFYISEVLYMHHGRCPMRASTSRNQFRSLMQQQLGQLYVQFYRKKTFIATKKHLSQKNMYRYNSPRKLALFCFKSLLLEPLRRIPSCTTDANLSH